MFRICRCLGVVSVSALLGGTALAATPEQTSAAATLNQSVEQGLRDAQTKRAAHDFAGAVKTLSQLMLIAADDPRVVGEYGKVLVQQGRSREAIDFLGRAAQLKDNDWTVYSALGIAYDQTGNFDNARMAYERALTLNPGAIVVLNNYAMSRAQAGDLAEARHLISEASADGKDERIARNVKMINALTPKAGAVAHAAPPAPTLARAPAPKPANTVPANVATGAPRTLTAAEGRTIMMQAVPADPKAGSLAAKSKPSRKAVAKKADDGIPALRLANDRQ